MTAKPGIRIRSARPADLDALVGLLRELFEIEADFSFCERRQRAGLSMLLRCQRARVLVAEVGGKVRGLCTVQLVVSTAEGAWSGLLEDMIVHHCWRGMGIGRRLMQAACTWTRRRGATRLQLLADQDNQPAHRFYERMAWSPTRMVALRKLLQGTAVDEPAGR